MHTLKSLLNRSLRNKKKAKKYMHIRHPKIRKKDKHRLLSYGQHTIFMADAITVNQSSRLIVEHNITIKQSISTFFHMLESGRDNMPISN